MQLARSHRNRVGLSQAKLEELLRGSAYPAAMFRKFENGNQDHQTNNGQSVADWVTLGDRDALFLVRTP